MTLRLKEHEKLVERMVEAARQHEGLRSSVRAALDALLTAVVEMGVGREAQATLIQHGPSDEPPLEDWQACTAWRNRDFPAIILQLEDQQHDE